MSNVCETKSGAALTDIPHTRQFLLVNARVRHVKNGKIYETNPEKCKRQHKIN